MFVYVRSCGESAHASRLMAQFLREHAEHDSGFPARTYARTGYGIYGRRGIPCSHPFPRSPTVSLNYFCILVTCTPSALRCYSARTLHFLLLNPARPAFAVGETATSAITNPFSPAHPSLVRPTASPFILFFHLFHCQRINRASSRVPITSSSSSSSTLLHRAVIRSTTKIVRGTYTL